MREAFTMMANTEFTSQITIEQAKREDFQAMIQLADLTMPDRMNLHELKKYIELFSDLIFKATHDDQVVGFCCAGIDMYQTTGWLLFSTLQEDYRGQGIGKRFIEARLQALSQFPTLRRVLVTVNESNIPSRRAIESFGFRLSHSEINYYGPGKDRGIFQLHVPNSQLQVSSQQDAFPLCHLHE